MDNRTIKALESQLIDSMMAPAMSGLGFSIGDITKAVGKITEPVKQAVSRNITEPVKKATAGVINQLPGPLKQAAQNVSMITSKPWEYHTLAVEDPKKLVSTVSKDMQEAAPYVAAGAALYFGGPYVWQALQSSPATMTFLKAQAMKYGGKEVAKQMMGTPQAPAPAVAPVYQSAMQQNPSLASLYGAPPEVILSNPSVQGAIAQALQAQSASGGALMVSPEAAQLTKAIGQKGAQDLARRTTGGDVKGPALALGLPLATLLLS